VCEGLAQGPYTVTALDRTPREWKAESSIFCADECVGDKGCKDF